MESIYPLTVTLTKKEEIYKVWYTNNGVRTLAYEYEYTADGQVAEFIDCTKNSNVIYSYDNNGRLIGFDEFENGENSSGFSSTYSYSKDNELLNRVF